MGVFAEKLRYLRTQGQIDQGTLAQQLGLASHSHISHLEAGRKDPSLELVCRCARYFQVTTDYLLDNTIAVDAVEYSSHPSDRSFLLHTGDKIRTLRRIHGLTQGEFAQQLGLRNHTNISFIEASRREPPLALIVQCARFFGVTTDYLLWDDES